MSAIRSAASSIPPTMPSAPFAAPFPSAAVFPEGLPADGLQAEGPNARFAGYSYKDTAYPRCTERFAVLNEFADVHFAIAMDEPIVNNMANTMMVFGLLVK